MAYRLNIKGILAQVPLLLMALTLSCSGNADVPTQSAATPVPPPTVTALAIRAPTANPPQVPTPRPVPLGTVVPMATPTHIPAPTDMPTAVPPPTRTSTPSVADRVPPKDTTAPDGRWEGISKVPGMGELPFTVTFSESDSVLQATMDIPTQGAIGLELSRVAFESGSLHFELESPLGVAVWEGKVLGSVIEGDFSQAGIQGAFRLERVKDQVSEAVEAEEGSALFRREEVTFANGDVTLAGDLTFPDGDGPYPAVVFISGSGGQDRDSNFFGFKFFEVLVQHIIPLGAAVLRFDDRGFGGSDGSELTTTLNDRAEDVKAAVDYLLAHDNIDPERIGLLGHSEGGIVAPMVATQSDDIAYVILLAAPAVIGESILRRQLLETMGANGAAEEEIRQAQAQQELTFRAVLTDDGWDGVEAAVKTAARERFDALPASIRGSIRDINLFIDTVVRREMRFVQSPWFESIVKVDPDPILGRLTVPVLALYSELDTQVSAKINSEAFSKAISGAGNSDYTITTIVGANHLFQEAATGSPNEYGGLEPEFAPELVDLLREWLLRQVGGP